MDLDKAVICKALADLSIAPFVEAGVRPELFEGDARAIWSWMVDHTARFGAVPGAHAFSEKWPTYVRSGITTETPAWYAEELRKRYRHNRLREALILSADNLKNGNTDAGVDVVKDALRDIDGLTTGTRDIDWTQVVGGEQLDAYDQLKGVDGGITGVRTPFDSLDRATLGFQPGDLVFITARKKTGKTWFLLLCAQHSWSLGKRPLVLTREMPQSQILRRLTAATFRLPYGKLRAGELSDEHEEAWRKRAPLMADAQPLWVVGDGLRDQGGGVSALRAKAELRKPDVIYIDGMYLMDDDRKARENWMRMTNIARDLKGLAMDLKIPVVVTLQLNYDGKIADRDLSRECDVNIRLERDEDDKLTDRMTIALDDLREGAGDFEMRAIWDLTKMLFEEVDERAMFGSVADLDEVFDDGQEVLF